MALESLKVEVTAPGSPVVEQELVAHVFAPVDGPHAGDALRQIRQLWSGCRDILGMSEPITSTGLPGGLDEQAGAAAGAIAAAQSLDTNFQAVLRRERDTLGMSILLAPPGDPAACGPLWPELDRRKGRLL